MNNELSAKIKQIIVEEYGFETEVAIDNTSQTFGDVSTNIALQISSKVSKPPKEIAQFIASKISDIEGVEKVEMAGPGFINIVFDIIGISFSAIYTGPVL